MNDNDNFEQKAARIDEGLKKFKFKPGKFLKKEKNSDRVTGERVFAEIVAGLIVGVLFGLGLDRVFESKPLFLILMIILGLAGSVYNIYKALQKEEHNKQN